MLRALRLIPFVAVWLVFGWLLITPACGDGLRFTRGDANADGNVDITDAISFLLSLFAGAPDSSRCSDAADANDDGALDISDAVYTLGFLFLGGASPPPPSGECGLDPTADGLSCESFTPCPPPLDGERVAESWVARYTVSEVSRESSHALTVDENGNVYVTGTADLSHDGGDSYPDSDMITVKYDSTGRELWAARYAGYDDGNSGQAIAVDSDGHVYVGGISGGGDHGTQDMVVAKYNSAGTPLWQARYDGGGRDLLVAMTIDEEGAVYVTGESAASIATDEDTEEDWVTIQYDTHGNEVWVDRYNGPGGRSDSPAALALGPVGHLYVVGSAYGGIGSRSDYTLIKYTQTGRRVWVSHYDGDGGSADYATALAIDSAGNLCVTGRSHGVDRDFDHATVLFDANGSLLWAARYDGPAHGNDGAVAIAVDERRNVYVAGVSEGETEDDFDFVVVSYDPEGRTRWNVRHDGAEGGRDLVRGLALRDGEGVYVTGFVNGRRAGDTRGQDFCTVAYDLAGRERWVAVYDGPGRDWDEASAVVVSETGRVYVTGYSDMDCLTIEYVTTNAEVE